MVLDNESLVDALTEATLARDLPGMADIDSSLLLFCRDKKEVYGGAFGRVLRRNFRRIPVVSQ